MLPAASTSLIVPAACATSQPPAGNNRICAVDVATGAVSTLAGGPVPGDADGIGAAAQFNAPVALAADPSPERPLLYVADLGNGALRRLNTTSGAVTRLRGLTIAFRDAAVLPDGNLLVVDGGAVSRVVAATGAVDRQLVAAANTAGGAVDGIAIMYPAPPPPSPPPPLPPRPPPDRKSVV